MIERRRGSTSIVAILFSSPLIRMRSEQIVVSRRDLAGGPWQHQTVIAGANGGSFATSWRIKASSVFVAQWDGDSGRVGQGSSALKIRVH